MTTRIAKLGRERTIATLVRRVYEIADGTPPEILRRAEAKVLAANPRLAFPDGFTSGASIVVPPVPGLRRVGTDGAAGASGEGIVTEMTARFEAMQIRMDGAFRTSAATRAETLERISDRSFVAEARRALPESVEFIAAARSRLAQEEATEADTAKRLQTGVAEAIEALKALDALTRQPR